jgi:hypothetical protein
MYQPDKFIVLKVMPEGKEPFYKVFGTWLGGYLDGDSWRMNSGITSVEAQGPFLLFHGSSGSVYKVHKEMYGTSAWTQGILGMYLETGLFEVMPEDTDWVNFNWQGDKNE